MDALTLLEEAREVGLEVRADGTKLVVRGPRSAEAVAQRLLSHKAAVLSALALPEECRPVVEWARWIAERVPAEDVEVRFHEGPLTPVRLKLSEVGRYVSERLGNLAMLQSWEGAGTPDLKAGWRKERITDVCSALAGLRETLRPLGLAEVREQGES